MAVQQTKYFAFGSVGIEQEAGSHVRSKVIFALADEKQKKLAWYMFSQDLYLWNWWTHFVYAEEGAEQLIRIHGGAWSLPNRRRSGNSIQMFQTATLTLQRSLPKCPRVGAPGRHLKSAPTRIDLRNLCASSAPLSRYGRPLIRKMRLRLLPWFSTWRRKRSS